MSTDSPRPGLERARDLRLGPARAWIDPGALKAPAVGAAREVLVLASDEGCIVRFSFELLLERSARVPARTLRIPADGVGSISVSLGAAARRALGQAGSAKLRIRLRVTGPHGTRTDAKTLRLIA